MNKNLANYRRVYSKGELLEAELPANPMELFKDWFEEVEEGRDPMEVNAMTISTIGKDGFPKNRVVLLKEFDANGFTFYTNYTSDKGQSLEHNPRVCISFFWPQMERQVIIKGIAEKSSEEKAIEYFNSRPRGSQLGAWASNQSSEVASRTVLEDRLKDMEEKYRDKEVPKPKTWGGYLIRPTDFEFWQGRPNRLHDRIYYSRKINNWNIKRLAP
ncbi:MAG TPA: pyridoxamine 5'-phosphate oxidase [Gillisia sp.]|nr:pyridoxamine 5'-phosphate oxidase [Gillisia sp.]